MAEVVGAVANAASSIAIAAAVGAVVSLIYFIYKDLVSYIPYAGSVALGAMFALIFNPMDPFLGMGLGVTVAMATFLPLKVFVVSKWGGSGDDLPSGIDLARSMKTIAQFLCAGPVMGLAHATTKNIPVSLACAAGAFYLGGKYAWNPIVNFYLEMGFFGDRNCMSKKPDLVRCVYPCTTAEAALRSKAVWNTPPCDHAIDDNTKKWCTKKAEWESSCKWNSLATDPGPSPSGGNPPPPPSSPCSMYSDYKVAGDYSFNAFCGSTAPQLVLDRVLSGTNPPTAVTEQVFASYYPQGTQGRTYRFAKAVDGSSIAGRIQMIDNLGDWTISGNRIWSRENQDAGTIKHAPNWTCMWGYQDKIYPGFGGEYWWFFDNAPPAPIGDPPIAYQFSYRDYDTKDAPQYLARAWGQRRVCVPSGVGEDGRPVPQWNLDQQPVATDRSSFCARYDRDSQKGGWGVSKVVPSYPTKEFQCSVGAQTVPTGALKWPL